MQKNNLNIGIMGAGAFGTSLAILYSNFHEITLFSAFEDHVSEMKETRENEFLRGYILSSNISIKNISEVQTCSFDYIFWCFPMAPSLEILKKLSANIRHDVPIIICTKGISERGKFLLDDFVEILPNTPFGIISGPNFAVDIASLLYSAADLGFKDIKTAKNVSELLSNKFMKMFPTDDVIGLQIAGAMKNVVAIACGILVGLKAGQNAVSALLTYGLKEISTLGVALGARQETFYGLSGVGDLMLTSSSDTSRNMSFGKRLGNGELITDILKSSCAVSEGVVCVKHIFEMSKKAGIDSRICQTVCEIVNSTRKPDSILDLLK